VHKLLLRCDRDTSILFLIAGGLFVPFHFPPFLQPNMSLGIVGIKFSTYRLYSHHFIVITVHLVYGQSRKFSMKLYEILRFAVCQTCDMAILIFKGLYRPRTRADFSPSCITRNHQHRSSLRVPCPM
jgi:hypothetical protein